jgi:predicted ATP-dependent endonuclease of OLD family
MKLRRVWIREFKSIWDSGAFDVGPITCLVGKNESGKTAVLQAIYRLNPIVQGDCAFDVIDDYPRSEVENYQHDVERGKREAAVVIKATFVLEAGDLAAISEEYGDGVLAETDLELSRGYEKDSNGAPQLYVNVPVVESSVVRNLIARYALPTDVLSGLPQQQSLRALSEYLAAAGKEKEEAVAAAQSEAELIEDEAEKAAALEKAKSLAESEQAKALRSRLKDLAKHKNLGLHIWNTILADRFPKFLYFDEYYQMRGHDNVDALKKRKVANQLRKSDHPLLGLIQLARLDLDELLALKRTQELKNKLQGASNYLSSQILNYWSQNKHLRMHFDVRPGLAEDPEGMQSGTNIWGEVFDSRHLVSTGLGTRSAGFVWFFSFLAWYSAVKKKEQPLVLLLDEPGLSLHGRAQADLLGYFEAEIATTPNHQLIYTTHSPFMVDPVHFERVLIVQDKGIDTDEKLAREQDGTKVFTDVLDAGPDSLFPLQGALGYEIYQTLFVGPNCLVVEGVSDLLYIQTISGVLEGMGRVGLDARWTITPVGGSDKVPTFVALLGSQRNLNIATLVDFQKGDQQTIEGLYRKKLLKKSHVLTFAEFTGKPESDIEDMFDELFYLELVNGEFAKSLNATIKPADFKSQAPRILVRLAEHFEANPLRGNAKFNHFRPARFLTEKSATIAIPTSTLERFEAAFKAANALLY